MADGQHLLDVLRGDPTLLLDAEEQLLEVVKAVQETGQSGRLVLTLNVTTQKNANERAAVWINGVAVARAPRQPTEDRMYFAVGDSLSRRDPRQPALPQFEAVDKTTGEVPMSDTEAAAAQAAAAGMGD